MGLGTEYIELSSPNFSVANLGPVRPSSHISINFDPLTRGDKRNESNEYSSNLSPCDEAVPSRCLLRGRSSRVRDPSCTPSPTRSSRIRCLVLDISLFVLMLYYRERFCRELRSSTQDHFRVS